VGVFYRTPCDPLRPSGDRRGEEGEGEQATANRIMAGPPDGRDATLSGTGRQRALDG
jgi:hypothetical protein